MADEPPEDLEGCALELTELSSTGPDCHRGFSFLRSIMRGATAPRLFFLQDLLPLVDHEKARVRVLR